MTQELSLGIIKTPGENFGKEFRVPIDLIGHKNAVIGKSGCGKTCAVAVIEEELLRKGQPFAVLDTVGVHLGLRSFKDGRPTNYPIVVFGGKRGDLPINDKEVGFGARLAEIIYSAKFAVVIDLSRTMPEARFRIVAEIASTLMTMDAPDVRHIFIEETPEFLPQKVEFKGQEQAKGQLGRLVTLGRNNGYVATLIGQRWATMDKTPLGQIDNFVIMRTKVKADRSRLREIFEDEAPDVDLDVIFRSMGKLEDGEAWFVSPQWLKRLERVQFHERQTFHPGETRKVGVKLTQVDMGDVQKFVAELSKVLTKTVVHQPVKEQMVGDAVTVMGKMAVKDLKGMKRRGEVKGDWKIEPADAKELQKLTSQVAKLDVTVDELKAENGRLKGEIQGLKNRARVDAERLVSAREGIAPLYEALGKLFKETQATVAAGSEMIIDAGKYDAFLKRAGKYSAAGMLRIVMERKRIHKDQLRTLCAIRSSTYYTAQRWMVRTKLMIEDGDYYVFRPIE